MRNNGGKSRSRGEKLIAAREHTTIQGSQPANEELTESPLRNRVGKWKANTVSEHTDTSPSNSQSRKNTSKQQESRSRQGKDDTNTTTESEINSTPKGVSAATNTTGLLRSSTTHSAQKGSTPNPVGLPRSASTGSAQKDSTPFPTSAASNQARHYRTATANSASKDSDPKYYGNMERQRSSSKTANREGTLSESESHDEFEPTSVNNNNGGRRQDPMPAHGKRPADEDSPDEFEHQHYIDRNTHRRQHEKHGHGKRHKADANTGARTKHSTSSTKRRKQVLDSSSDEDNDFETPFDDAKMSRPDKSVSSEAKKKSSASNVTAIGNKRLLCYWITLHLCTHAFVHD